MKLPLFYKDGILSRKPIFVSSVLSRKGGQSVSALVGRRIISAKNLAALGDTLR
jgi:hypothetical protein